MATYKTKMINKEMIESYFNNLIKYAGQKRVQKLSTIYFNNKGISGNELMFLYEQSTNDCFEMSTFYDRITNKGFQRYNINAIEQFCQLVIDVLEGAVELGLFNKKRI